MKRLIILGIMFSLFAFGGNKEEVKTTYAAEGKTSAIFANVDAYYDDTLSGSVLKSYASSIVNMKFTTDNSEVPTSYLEKITIPNCIYEDANGNRSVPADGIIFAYISYATNSTTEHDCVFYANADKICTNVNANYFLSNFKAIKNLDIKELDTSNTTTMRRFFIGLSEIEYLDVSSMDTSKVTDMESMFSGCVKLKQVVFLDEFNKTSFNTSNVKVFNGMFHGCHIIEKIDLSTFDTSSAVSMSNMFAYCRELRELDISSFDMSHCSTFASEPFFGPGTEVEFFEECFQLETIKAPKALPADSGTNSTSALNLPEQFNTSCGVSALTVDNLSQYSLLDLKCGDFINSWNAFRTEFNGICDALVEGSDANTRYNELVVQYNAFDDERKAYIRGFVDNGNSSIGNSMDYVTNVLNGTQATTGDYGIAKEDSGSFMTLSIKEESPYLVVVISLIGVLSIAGYYFYSKKKHAM